MNREDRFDIQSLRPSGGRYKNKRTKRNYKTQQGDGKTRLMYNDYHIYVGKYAKYYWRIGLGGLLLGIIGLFMWLFGDNPDPNMDDQSVSTVGMILFIVGAVGVIISISIANLTGGKWYRSDEPLPSGVKYEDVIWINPPSASSLIDVV